jgi:hypothetical protein
MIKGEHRYWPARSLPFSSRVAFWDGCRREFLRDGLTGSRLARWVLYGLLHAPRPFNSVAGSLWADSMLPTMLPTRKH